MEEKLALCKLVVATNGVPCIEMSFGDAIYGQYPLNHDNPIAEVQAAINDAKEYGYAGIKFI